MSNQSSDPGSPRKRLIRGSLSGLIPFGKSEIERSIPARFEGLANGYPDRIAVKSEHTVLTYAALNQVANQVAHLALERQGEREEVVAFLLEHGLAQAVATLGILKAGKAYLPLDPSLPRARLAFMLRDTQAGLIVTNSQNLASAEELATSECQLVNLDQIAPNVSTEDSGLAISPDAMANIFYTSGSTGEPKGVVQNHRNMLHFMRTIGRSWPIYADDRIAHFIPCSFSAAMMPTLGALLNGAALMPFDTRQHGFTSLVNWLAEKEITIYFSVTSVFRHFVEALPKSERLPHLRLVVVGGETLYKKDVDLYKRRFSPDCVLLNILAGTEMLYIRHHFMNKKSEITGDVAPVGCAVEDKEVLLLDDDGRAVGPDEMGEIVVKSRYISPGYWRAPERTEAVFSPDPAGGPERLYRTGDLGRMQPDGCLVHLGRKDGMVKIRGQRVEVGEVERALVSLQNIKEAVVVARERGGETGTKHLVAYVVSEGEPEPTAAGLRLSLQRTLPNYMIPSHFVVLEAIPRNPSGKVDRQALPDPTHGRSRPDLGNEFVPPSNALEAQLAQIWEDVLDIHPIGVTDSFFDLGGDSLLAVSLFVHAEKQLGRELPVTALFPSPTIEQMAAALSGSREGSLASPGEASPSSAERLLAPRHESLRPSTRIRRSARRPTQAEPGWDRERAPWLNRSILGLARLAHVILPDSMAASSLNWLLGQRWVQERVFTEQVRTIQQFLSQLDLPAADDANAVRRALMYEAWGQALIRRPQGLERWLTLSGLSMLQHSHGKGNGVVLVSRHTRCTPLLDPLLDSLGFADHVRIGRVGSVARQVTRPGRSERSSRRNARLSALTSQLLLGKQVLAGGGLVYLLPDVATGKSQGMDISFFGRMHNFKTGFAELALAAGADVIPVSFSMDLRGSVTASFLEPFDTGPADVSHAERVESLVRQYVAFLEKEWASDPASPTLHVMRRHLRRAVSIVHDVE